MHSFYREAQGLRLSSLGIGTYLGAVDDATDESYKQAILAALDGGINVIDTSLNYRHQRSERAIGRALALWTGDRKEVVVCTKAGYLVPGAVPADQLRPEEVVDGIHSMAPAFLDDQLDRSRSNLGADSIDVFYLHNPETQWGKVGEEEFYSRIRAAFAFCERAATKGRIRYYGVATWDAFRRGMESVSLRSLVSIAREVAGDGHRFRFIQLPVNLAMLESLSKPVESDLTVLDLAAELGITVVASATMLQARLLGRIPEAVGNLIGGITDAQRAIQFARSTPGVTVALAGMSKPEHVQENLELRAIPPASLDTFRQLFR